MTKQKNTGPEAARGKQSVDPTEPVFLVYHQTRKGVSLDLFAGDDCENLAYKMAEDIALKTGVYVAVFGPQASVKIRRGSSVEDLPLPFND